MTASPKLELAAAPPAARTLRSSVAEAVLATLLFALVTGAWLAFFLFLPLDFMPPRVG